jgi:hypothetical protein
MAAVEKLRPGDESFRPQTYMETIVMEKTLLDTAFRLITDYSMLKDTLNPYADLDKRNLHELKVQFPRETPGAVEDAYRRAQHLRDVAVELADESRGPRNDGTGPAFDVRALTERCPGFSRESYDAACNLGFMLTRK